MDEIHKTALKKTRVALVEDLDVDHITDHLLAEEIFTPLMLEYIKGERNRIDKTRRLLDDLPRRGPRAYKKFLICLRKCEYGFLADKIEHNENQIRKDKGLVSTHVEQPTNEENSAIHISSSYQSLSTAVGHSGEGDMNFSSTSSQLTTSQSPSESSNSEVGSMQTSEASSSQTNESSSAKKAKIDKNSDDDSLDLLVEGMDYEDEIDSATERALLSDQGQTTPENARQNQEETTQAASQPVISQPVDDTNSQYPGASRLSFQSEYEKNKDKSYRMDSNPRGLVLIINNKRFTNMQERLGTEKDGGRLQQMFHKMGCGVKMEENATLMEMKQHLKEFAQHPDLNHVDCLFVVLLSHGKENGGVCGTDGRDISAQDIMEMFSAKNCPAMINKPKMFIINACRGERDGSSISIEIQGATRNVEADHVEREVNPVGRSAPLQPSQQRVVNLQDMITAYSTFHGHVAYRNTEDGSWFIQDLVRVFEDKWHEEDVLYLLTLVNQEVSRREDQEFAQVPSPEYSLTKKWYLNPLTNFPHL